MVSILIPLPNAHRCEKVLMQEGVADLARYAAAPGNREFLPDLFID